MLLEAALNVVLPSNGEAWVKLRSDDFSDLDEHYVLRSEMGDTSAGSGLPVLSNELVSVIKGLMRSSPLERTTLAELDEMEVMRRLSGSSCRALALVMEDEAWLDRLLA